MSGLAELARAAQAALESRPNVPLALATLFDVEGSSYRQPGARLLVDADGRVLAGAISGGCLEGDVAARAAEVCKSGQAIALRYDLRNDLETIWGFGSACDGIAHIMLEPVGDARWLADAASIRSARDGGALLTIAGEGPTLGTVALLRGSAASGNWTTLGGGDTSFDRVRASRLADVAQKTASAECERTVDAASTDVASDGASTDGASTDHARTVGASAVDARADRYFVEPLMPAVSLFLVGAGRGAEALARIATTLGWAVTVIDHRQALLDALVLPADVRVVCARAEDGASLITHDPRTAVALLTHIYDVDQAWLSALLPLPVGYLGVLGSRARAARLLESLASIIDTSSPTSRALHAPIGLDLGGENPESIALAAVAEIEAVMHGRPGGFLRERESPIHTRTPTPIPHA